MVSSDVAVGPLQGQPIGLRGHKHHPVGYCAVGSSEQVFQTGSLWARWELQMCFVGHRCLKENPNSCQCFFHLLSQCLLIHLGRVTGGLLYAQYAQGHPCPHRVEVLMAGGREGTIVEESNKEAQKHPSGLSSVGREVSCLGKLVLPEAGISAGPGRTAT